MRIGWMVVNRIPGRGGGGKTDCLALSPSSVSALVIYKLGIASLITRYRVSNGVLLTTCLTP